MRRWPARIRSRANRSNPLRRLTQSHPDLKLPARLMVQWVEFSDPPGGGKGSPVTGPSRGRRSFRLSSTMESVSEVEAAADQLATEAGLDEDQRFHIGMAVREAAINAVLHGNEYDPRPPDRSFAGKHGQGPGDCDCRPGPWIQSGQCARSACRREHSSRNRPRHLPHPVADG